MHVVIIGGGAAGMATAFYLTRRHRVTVLEKQPLLGGNIRTLNRNVAGGSLPAGLYLDNGVIEFHRRHSPGLHALVGELGLELTPFEGGSTGLYLEDGRSFHMPGAIRDQRRRATTRALQYLKLVWLMRGLAPIGLRMLRARSRPDQPVTALLGADEMSQWIRMLLMYGYSIPYPLIDDFPASLAIPTLMQGAPGTEWVRLEGGVFRYIEEIIARSGDSLEVRTGQDILAVTRGAGDVRVECAGGTVTADRVVFATPPDQVPALLADATAEERRCFGGWQASYAETVIHTDESIYADWELRGFTEFDVFEKDGGRDAGYNAYLNRLCKVPEGHGRRYFLAYNLDDRIDPARILDRQRHHTPLYSHRTIASVAEIKARNGLHNTCFAGAWLYNGLHEGAIQSALAVKAHFEV